jgi:thymidylate synthase
MNRLNLISAVDNKLGIGQNGDLLFKEMDDLRYFKRLTEGSTIVMGHKTFRSLGGPLPNRKHIVLTRNYSKVTLHDQVIYLTFPLFKLYYYLCKKETFWIIGGGEIYNLFVNHPTFYPFRMYITQFDKINKDADTFFPLIPSKYNLVSYSQKYTGKYCQFRFLKYVYSKCPKNDTDHVYLNLAKSVLDNGRGREDRTGVGTISTFGNQLRFNLSEGVIPILTTKRIAWRSCLKELLWFLRGDTDAKILQKSGVHIWDGNSSREFLDKHGLDYPDGVIGAGYGWQMRFFGAEYDHLLSDTSSRYFNRSEVGGVDQIEWIVSQLRQNPDSRRIVMSYWNPPDLDKVALPPCHYSCVFNTHVEAGLESVRKLSCHMVMRSTDVFLGLPFNILSYALLTCIIAKRVDMEPHTLVISLSDTHIYKNHIDQIKLQLKKQPLANAMIVINDRIKDIPIEEISIDDFQLIGYFPHPTISGVMAV